MGVHGGPAFSDLLYVSTSSLSSDSVVDSVERLSSCTSHIELSGGCLYDPDLLAGLQRLKRERGLHFLVHGYFPPPRTNFVMNFADGAPRTREFVDESMRFVRALEAPYYSGHPGFIKDFTFDGRRLVETGTARRYTLEDLGRAIEWFGREYPAERLVLENLYPIDTDPETCLMMTPDEIYWIMKRYQNLYLLLDLGHLKVSAGVLGFDLAASVSLMLEIFSDRTLEIHLSENNGSHDDHLLPGPGSDQHVIVEEYAGLIKESRINLTIETRRSTLEAIGESLSFINGLLA